MLESTRKEQQKNKENQYHHYDTVVIGISPTPGVLQMVVC